MNTRRAEARAQQRRTAPMADQLPDGHGRKGHDGHGAVMVYLNKDSGPNIKRDLGRRLVSRRAERFDAYRVKSADDLTITVGHRTRRLWRK